MMRVQAGVLIVACGILLGTDVTRTQPPASPPGQAIRPQVQGPDRHDVSPALRDMPVIPPSAAGRQPFPPRPVWRGRLSQVPAASDPALQTSAPLFSAPTASASFEGVNNLNSVLPPDTNGDIGPNHYVQWVNLSFAIYSRSGDVLYGPANGSSLWQGFGGPCETRNDGDPIVLYDEHADRWLMSQFALPNFPSGPFYQCIAVSQTGNPLGSYHRYQYSFSKLNDYPKFGVWPDGYYMSINQFTCSGKGLFVSCSWAGQGVAAFDRAQMLAGGSATMVYRDMFSTDDTLGGMLPSDLDGPLPPAGTPNYYMQFDDDAWEYSPEDQLQIWEFKVNWSAPATSTFTKKATLATAAFDSNMCEYNRSCIPQAGTSVKLDAISDRVMYRLQYRNFGSYGTLVTNHTVDVNGQDHAGVRWYEVRLNSGTPSLHQQGTFAPDTNHRWMASAAMDKAGNIAMGYNVSSSTSFPRISFTGRKVTDTAGQMTLGEGDIMLGTGSQTHSSSRWGDYSLLAVDPTDGCTFWFTTEYLSDTSSIGWRTRVGAFQIEGCTSGGGGGTDPLEAPSNLTVTSVSATQVGLSWTDNSDDETNFRVERCTGSSCSTFAEIGTSTSATFTDTVAANTHSYRVRAWRSSDNVFSSYSNTVTAVMPPDAPTITSATASSSSQINLAWSDNSTNEANFHVDRCQGTGCTPTDAHLIATLPAGTTNYSNTGLTPETTYVYRVRATNSTASVPSTNAAEVTTLAQSTAASVHVASLTGVGIKASGPNWFARVTILVVDNNGNAVSGATVTGSWTGTTGPTSCATGSNGSCSLDSAGVHNRVGSVSFTVTNVTHTSLSYNSEGNSATSVVITKP